eukprot:4988230-Pyramimonas_sp.AAC.1
MIEWMRKISCEQPSRCSIIFGGDVNDHSGIPPPGHVVDAMNPIGPLNPAQEHYCMHKLRGYMEDFGL